MNKSNFMMKAVYSGSGKPIYAKELADRINEAIEFLENNGYIVGKDYSNLIGKWAAFYQEGMEPILHGKVKDVSIKGCCSIKCKNGCVRSVNVDDVIEFCDKKDQCYMIK